MGLSRGALGLLLISGVASAQMLMDRAPPQHRIAYKNLTALRYNPLGLLDDARFMYRYRLYETDKVALRDNFIGVGLAPTFSPAMLKIGPYVEFNPSTVFGVWSAIQFVQYFGSFNLLQSFPGAQSDFSDTAIKNNSAQRQATNGFEVTIGANLNLKFGPIVVRSFFRAIYGSMNVRPGDRVHYDQFYDVLMPNKGWSLTNDLDVLGQFFMNRIVAGVRYTLTVPLYAKTRHYDPSDPIQQVNNNMHRVGPLVGYTFFSEDGAGFNNPTIFLLVQWWAQHRFRTGADTSAALPLMGLGFQFTGDLLPFK